MGDQKYLDVWPEQYAECHIIENLGAGVAPWNYSQYTFSSSLDGHITVDGVPLIFYHFHQFQVRGMNDYDRISSFYNDYRPVPEGVYRAYEEELDRIMSYEVRQHIASLVTNTRASRLKRFFDRAASSVNFFNVIK